MLAALAYILTASPDQTHPLKVGTELGID